MGVKVYLASAGGEAVDDLSCQHIRLPLRTKSEISPRLYLSYFKLRTLVKEIDLLHANSRITRVLAEKLSSKHLPYISTIHGYHKPKLKNLILPYWGKKVIAISKFVKRHLISDFKLRSEKIKVIYNGIDLEYFRSFSPSPQELKEKFGYRDEFLLLAISRLSHVKGLEYLLEAFRIFWEQSRDGLLLIAGEGKAREKIEGLIHKFSLSSRVRLLGVVKEIRPLLKMADVFVQPSLQEGLGISILEALAMSKPVVATASGGIAEIIQDGYNGLLVPKADAGALAKAFLSLRREQELRQRLIQNAHSQIEQFDYKRMAQETYQLYQEVLK